MNILIDFMQSNKNAAQLASDIATGNCAFTFHGAAPSSPHSKIEVRPISLKDTLHYQMSKFLGNQVFHENVTPENFLQELYSLVPAQFSSVHIVSPLYSCDIKVTKKGKVLFKKQAQAASVKAENHNREKQYLLPLNTIIPPLVDLGIFTKEGKIVHAMYDKYKQINRFIEYVDDVLKAHTQDTVTILDLGCGKSYLTFIIYYYITEILGKKAQITGLDLKQDVVNSCNHFAQKYKYEGLTFLAGDIFDYTPPSPVDLVVSLHACDKATDYVLFCAVKMNIPAILSVPCCQHEINGQIKSENFNILTKYGIIKERLSALMTDAMRANLLTVCGYDTIISEFVDLAHSPKNLFLRAVKSSLSAEKRNRALKEVQSLMQEFSLCPTLFSLLSHDGFLTI